MRYLHCVGISISPGPCMQRNSEFRDKAHTSCAKSMDLGGEDEEDEAQDEQGVEARCSGHGAVSYLM